MCTQFTVVRIVAVPGVSGMGVANTHMYCYDRKGNLYSWRGDHKLTADDLPTYSGNRPKRLYRDYWEHVASQPTSKVRDDIDKLILRGKELLNAT